MNTYRVVAIVEPGSDIGNIDLVLYADSMAQAKANWNTICRQLGIRAAASIAQIA